MTQPLLIRADADPRMGTGHVMRSLALAQCWMDNVGPVTLAAHRLPDGLRDRLISEGVTVRAVSENIADTVELAKELSAAVVVLDGYHFTGDDERVFHDAGFPVLALDDYGHTTHTHATWVLNQNLGASEETYAARGPHTKLLLGSRYAMLRREFLEAVTHRRPCPVRVDNILVTMGGADPDNVTADVLRALAWSSQGAQNIRVVVGGSNPHAAVLEAIAKDHPHRITLLRNVTDMPALMAWADLAVTAGGTTCWELAACGVPMAVVTIADNQVALAKAIGAAGFGFDLGWPSELRGDDTIALLDSFIEDRATREEMSAAARKAVDGWGVSRVVQALQPAPVITLRRATAFDCRRIWEWANDPATRVVSFSSDPIPWETHQAWFARRLSDRVHCRFFIGHDADGVPIGMIRFDEQADHVLVSVNMAPESRGKGLGGLLVRRGTKLVANYYLHWPIVAWILPENPVSKRVFEKAGYRDTGLTEYAGRPAHRLVFQK